MKKRKQVSIYLDPELFAKVSAIGKMQDRAVSYLVVQAVRELVANLDKVSKLSGNVKPAKDDGLSDPVNPISAKTVRPKSKTRGSAARRK